MSSDADATGQPTGAMATASTQHIDQSQDDAKEIFLFQIWISAIASTLNLLRFQAEMVFMRYR